MTARQSRHSGAGKALAFTWLLLLAALGLILVDSGGPAAALALAPLALLVIPLLAGRNPSAPVVELALRLGRRDRPPHRSIRILKPRYREHAGVIPQLLLLAGSRQLRAPPVL